MQTKAEEQEDKELMESLGTSFIDASLASLPGTRTSILANNPREGVKVATAIQDELARCTGFAMSVAFVKMSGIAPFLMTLKELETRGVKGKILTTDYQLFTEPKALRTLLGLKNLEVRLFRVGNGKDSNGFHTKGYLFRDSRYCTFIIGSSNLTASALTSNFEWNTRLVSRVGGRLAQEVSSEFKSLWEDPRSRDAAEVIEAYETEKERADKIRRLAAKLAREEMDREKQGPALKRSILAPNPMQAKFVENLLALKEREGARRALLISATGTGKTYAAAFAVARLNPKRLLFLVHREQIARQACASFKRVLGGSTGDYGLLTGGIDESQDRKYIFATMQTMARLSRLKSFPKDHFDLVVIDEVHRAGADSYQRIMDHFEPEFWLGMTGSPDRTDGYDIYGLFDHHIAHEIRLQEALREDLLCPFHYFGIHDLEIAGKEHESRDFTAIEFNQRIDYVLKQADYYGSSGDRLMGLVFASGLDEAERIARAFTARGRRAVALSGDCDMTERAAAIERLTGPDGPTALDYIVTVEIFNEGIDIPRINQVILLRPTESPIIFIQQLGRGLRKSEGKEFVVILDFIGAYEKNFLIPTALSGDRSYLKDTMRRFVSTGSRLIPGASTVQFDRIAKERIFAAIDKAKTKDISLLKEAYKNLKFKLGRIPELADFEDHGSVDAVKFFSGARFSSYYEFLVNYETEYKVRLSVDATKFANWISQKIGNGIRPSEAVVIQLVLEGSSDIKGEFKRRLVELTGLEATTRHLVSVEKVLTNGFERTAQDARRRTGCEIIEPGSDGSWKPARRFLEALEDENFRKIASDLTTFVIDRWSRHYRDREEESFLVIGKTYTYEDVCRLLDWEKNVTSLNIGGYIYDKGTKTFPIFVNYEKEDDANQYEDRFLSDRDIVTVSKRGRAVDSVDAFRMQKLGEYSDVRVLLFIRRNKDDNEAKAFYYLGEMEPREKPVSMERVLKATPGEIQKSKVFEMPWRLRTPVRPDLFDYLTGKNFEAN